MGEGDAILHECDVKGWQPITGVKIGLENDSIYRRLVCARAPALQLAAGLAFGHVEENGICELMGKALVLTMKHLYDLPLLESVNPFHIRARTT